MSLQVSVVIATYNRAAMVAQAVAAALAQTRPPDEIIVSDDASRDATWSTLLKLEHRDPRVRIFRQASNTGGAGNWNLALRQARGDVLALCSDDDRWLPAHLAQSLAFLEAHPEFGMVHSGFVDAIETSNGSQQATRRRRSNLPLIVNHSNLLGYMTRYFDWPFHPSTLVFRRELWKQIGEFNPRYALTDTDWFVRVAEHFEIAMLPVDGVINRRHAGNWSNRLGSAHMQREIFEIVEGAIGRRKPWVRPWWRLLWRNNARLRLVLTIRARLRTGHGNAACTAWSALMNGTGRNFPNWLARAGADRILKLCAGRLARFDDARQ
ncbi:MAG TPA: glycosyltransferase family 2 protein, partial [Bryobacteraceae bacterium]|nr:glycosyltransferase family 2 protein [Bryobacteraceae bacterium]